MLSARHPDNSWKPAFGAYFTGPWPYDYDVGVGLAMSGRPTDDLALINLLMDVSCNPAAARRILDELKSGKTKKTTVMSQLNFRRIGDQLAALGG